MKDFCCKVCNSTDGFSKISLGRAFFAVDSTDNKRSSFVGQWGMINDLYICNFCSVIFTDPEKLSFTKEEQEQRRKTEAQLNRVITQNIPF